MDADTKIIRRFILCFTLRISTAIFVTYLVFNADTMLARWVGIVPLVIFLGLGGRHIGALGNPDMSLLDKHNAWWGDGQLNPRVVHAAVNFVAAILILSRFSDLSAKIGGIIMLSDPVLGVIIFCTHYQKTKDAKYEHCSQTQRSVRMDFTDSADDDNDVFTKVHNAES